LIGKRFPASSNSVAARMAHIGGAAAARDERPLLDDGIESTPTTQKGRSDVVVLKKGWRRFILIFFFQTKKIIPR
jgi:hypothetical protein